MCGMFKKESAEDHFLTVATENMDKMCTFFSKKYEKIVFDPKIHIRAPKKDGPMEDKVLFNLLCAAQYYNVDCVEKVDTMMGSDAIAKSAKSPLPSIKITGMYCRVGN